MTDEELLKSLDALRSTMISVASGGPRIQQVQQRFTPLYDAVADELARRSITNPIPYRDLWDWYGRWSSGDLPTYQSRRDFVSAIFSPLVAVVRTGVPTQFEPTGWQRVDRGVTHMRNQLAAAVNEEQFQAVGLLCREILISAAQAVFDPEKHQTTDGVTATATDAKRMLDAYIATELASGANEYIRKHARAALDLAVNLQHKRTATFREAALCAEATTSVVNLISIVAGRRDPNPK
jgi:hypothetical protein